MVPAPSKEIHQELTGIEKLMLVEEEEEFNSVRERTPIRVAIDEP